MKKLLFFISLLTFSCYAQQFQFPFERSWATYFSNNAVVNATAMDSQGNLYLVGSSSSLPFVTNYTHQAVHQGNGDGFIVKINAVGATVWGTYFGGNGYDAILAIAVDATDNLYVLGTTNSTTGIADTDAYQPLNAGGSDAFVAKFTAMGTKLWSTYYGGTENDGGSGYFFFEEGSSPVGIAVDAVGNAYIHTMMQSPGMASVGAFQQNPLQEDQYIAIIACFSSAGTRLWSTYYGINGSQMGGITANATGLYVTGRTLDCPPSYTNNTYFSTAGSHQPQPGSCRDVFLTKFDFNGQRVWSTYFGGNISENIRTNHLKSYGSFVYLSGTTFSGSGIATPGAFQETRSLSGEDIFLAKFDENGNRLWGTYCGTNSAQTEGLTAIPALTPKGMCTFAALLISQKTLLLPALTNLSKQAAGIALPSSLILKAKKYGALIMVDQKMTARLKSLYTKIVFTSWASRAAPIILAPQTGCSLQQILAIQ